jgi:hypothetical protein
LQVTDEGVVLDAHVLHHLAEAGGRLEMSYGRHIIRTR